MFDLGWPELLVIAIVMIVVVGPKDLPRVLRSLGRTTAKMRTMAGDFRRQFDEALREAELDGVVDDVKKLDPRGEIRKHLSPFEEAGRDIRKGLDDSMKAKPAASQVPKEATAAEPKAAAPRKTGATNLPGEKPPSSVGKAAKPKTARTASKSASAKTKKAPGKTTGARKAPATTKKVAEKPAEASVARGRKKKTAGTTS